LIADEQFRQWLTRLDAAAEDFCETRWIASEIQRRSRPGALHSAATECRIASFRATTYGATQRHVQAARTAIAALQHALETLIRKAAA
jgi:hypothetical protein